MKNQPISNLFPDDLNAIAHARGFTATIVLRAAHNALAPVSRLPSEVLARIFLFCAELSPSSMDHRPEEHVYDSDESDSPYKPSPINLGWLQVTHVCKSWRQAALYYPHIWTKIRGFSICWLQEALARGRSVPISVSVGNPESFEWDFTATAAHGEELAKHVSRLRDIVLSARVGAILDILEPMMASPVKVLQSLKLRNRGNRNLCLPSDLFGGHAPMLRTVYLCDVIIPWSTPILHNLTDLTVILSRGILDDEEEEEEEEDESIPSLFDGLLRGLRNMSSLQKLRLSGCLPPRSQHSTEDSIDLPMLRTLQLLDHATRCSDFLKCIQIPSSCNLVLYEYGSGEALGSEIDFLFHEHASREQGPFQSLILDVDHTSLCRFQVMRMGGDEETEVTYVLENRCLLQPYQESVPTSLDSITAWCHKFPIDNLRHLRVKLTWCNWFYATPQEWIDTFGRCVALEEVEIYSNRRPQTHAFWTALTMCVPQGSASSDTLFLPNLRHLTLDGPCDIFSYYGQKPQTTIQESLLEQLDIRQKAKAIGTVNIKGLSKRPDAGKMFVAGLERIVSEVKWCSD